LKREYKAWSLARDWEGEDAFLIGGGTSVDVKAVARLQGRPKARSIAINSSYLIAPWADMLFFGDERWWTREIKERAKALLAFAGDIATIRVGVHHNRVHVLKRIVPSAEHPLSTELDTVAMQLTSTHAAINIAVLRGARRIILVGIDNRDGDNGRIHHHAEYPWYRRKVTWDVKMQQLSYTVPALAAAGVEVINASLISTLPWWPKCTLADFLDREDAPRGCDHRKDSQGICVFDCEHIGEREHDEEN
jgi:hypothetical protein